MAQSVMTCYLTVFPYQKTSQSTPHQTPGHPMPLSITRARIADA